MHGIAANFVINKPQRSTTFLELSTTEYYISCSNQKQGKLTNCFYIVCFYVIIENGIGFFKLVESVVVDAM